MKIRDLPIGIENYKEASAKYYVDKTLLLRDILERGEGKAILLTRPRRFGKSLALSMVDYFFNVKEQSRSLFEDRLIWSIPGIESKINSHPVIHLNMKGLEQSRSVSILDAVKDRIFLLYREYPELLDSASLDAVEKEEFEAIYSKRADPVLLVSSLQRLSRFLFKHYGEKTVLLIDEYDGPIQSAFESGCYEEVMEFFKPFYGGALKGNDNLYFALLSGVLQISKESLFSGLNNLLVSSVASRFLGDYFGFTETEVSQMLKDFEVNVDPAVVREYYGGYLLSSGKEVYNPWSILNFVEERKIKSFWANTGSNELLLSVIRMEKSRISLLDFLNNATKKAPFNPAISYKDIRENAASSLSFLAQTGYLSLSADSSDYLNDVYEYRIPNREIYEVFKTEVIGRSVDPESMDVASRLKESILAQQEEEIQSILQQYLLSALSTYDLSDERNYHNAITGLLAVLFDHYVVKNEVDSGTGRCDILMIPKEPKQIGIVIEVKRSRAKDPLSKARLNRLAAQAIAQAKRKDYPEILRQAGCAAIYLYGFAFQNKASSIASEKFA
ncbi:MAG: AAA family ATPase [Bacilli bacterium]|nr:AAA family ATPase [Bacilli bacterium]